MSGCWFLALEAGSWHGRSSSNISRCEHQHHHHQSSSSRCSCNTAAGTASAAAAAGTGDPAATSSSSMANQQKSNPPTPANARGSASGQRGCPTPTPTLLWKLFDCSSTTAAVGAATSTSAGSSRTTTTTATTTTTHPSFRAMVFSCRAIESLKKGCFSSLSDGTLGTFFGVVLDLARPSEPWCFPAGSWFFRRCFPASSRRQ